MSHRPDPGRGRARRTFTAIVMAATLVVTVGVTDIPERVVLRSVDEQATAEQMEESATNTVGAAAAAEAIVVDDPFADTPPATTDDTDPDDAAASDTAADDTGSDAAPARTPQTTAPAPVPAPAQAPAPTTTAPEPVAAAPAPGGPLDETAAHLDPGSGDPYARALAAYETAVPQEWRAATPIHLEVRSGSTSLAYPSGTIAVGANQMDTWRHALYVVAHEWGHQAAFRFGSGHYNGAPPVGWPGMSGLMGAEQFAECVAQHLVGFRWPNPYPRCSDSAMTWTANWLANGPA